MDYDVTVKRNDYIGGSDIPVIMNISPFKTRYDLLLEKAGLKENTFSGNSYTVYGQHLEPKIREHINKRRKNKFEPNRVINGDLRCHSDGFNGNAVLEIKTTSHIYETAGEYKVYLVQLLLYMQMNGVKKGMLAVYERAEDFNEEFDPSRLHIYDIDIKDYKALLDEVNAEIVRFRADLARLKENPLLCEEDFQPSELVRLSRQVVEFESKLLEYKRLEEQHKAIKQQLFEAMQKYDVKSWETINGVKISRVDGTVGKVEMVTKFDEKNFAAENPELYKMYQKKIEKRISGRSGYVRIAVPK